MDFGIIFVIVLSFLATSHAALPAITVGPTMAASTLTKTGVEVTWTKPTGVFPKYVMSLTPSHGNMNPSDVKFADATKTTLSGLTPGTKYVFSVRTADATAQGAASTVTFTTKPLPALAASVIFSNVKSETATATWTKPSGDATSCAVTISPTATIAKLTVQSTNLQTTDISGLTGGTEYALTITCTSSITTGDETTKKFKTKPSPLQVSLIKLSKVEVATATATWDKPLGTYTSCAVTISPTATIAKPTVLYTDPQTTDISGLTGGTDYTLTITCTSGTTIGDATTKKFTTKPSPLQVSLIKFSKVEVATATVTWTKPLGTYTSCAVTISPTATIAKPTVLITDPQTTDISGLTGGTDYTLTITCTSGTTTGDATTKKFTTSLNLAYKKPAFQYNNYDILTPASKATDGNSDGNFWNSCQSTDSEQNAWWAVDLGSSTTVGEVRIVNRADHSPHRLANFDVIVSNIIPPISGRLNNIAQLRRTGLCIYRLKQMPRLGKTTLHCTSRKTGRYVYVILRGKNYLTMCEVEVFKSTSETPLHYINECTETGALKHNCHTNADCANYPGYFTCACKAGYKGDGKTKCDEINECTETGSLKHNCHTNAACANYPGSFTCACKAGYKGDGTTKCDDINECTETGSLKHNCHTNADCANYPGSFTCACKAGYTGNGITCFDGVSLCPAETHEGIPWSATVVGGSDSQMCMVGYVGTASRKCSKNANGYGWERPSLVHCVSHEMQEVYLESSDLANGIDKSTVEASSARLRKVTGGKTKLVSGELFKSVSIIENFVTAEEIQGSGTDLTEQNIVESASNILDLKYVSSWLDVQELYAGTALLMKQVDRYGRMVSGRHVQNKWRVVPSKNIVLQTKKAKATEMNLDAKIQRVVFPDSDIPTWAKKELTQLSVDVKAIYGDAVVGLSGLLYKTLNVLLPVDDSENATSISTVNSDILALSITAERNTGRFDPPIRLKFKHVEKNFTNATCNFWDFNANKTAEMRKNVGAWSTAGCELIVAESHDDDYTTCECDHLTNFAILMSPGKTIKTPVALKYMTWIGCGISLVCLVMTVIIYAIYWKKLDSERSVILLNLCVSLILALVTFLAGVERKENKHVCTAIAAMLHFFFLAVFSFMLMEGIELYILLVKVFAFGGGRKKWYILGGWGLPAVVVGISLGATQAKGYGNEDYCWLSLDNGLLWAFVVPALIIILINCVFLGMAMKAILTTKSMEAQSKQNKAKHGVRGLCILMPLLGTTWVFGVLAVNNDTIAFQYIFTICNSLQGLFIFIFHCLMNQHLLKLWKETRGRRASSSGSSNTKQMKPRIKQNKYTRNKPRKASLSTDDMTLGWESGGSEFKPDPKLGVKNNRAFDDSELNDSITHQTKPVDHNSIDFSVSY